MMKLYMSNSNFLYNNGKSQSNSEIFNYNNGKGNYQRYKNNNLIENKNFNKKQLENFLKSKKTLQQVNKVQLPHRYSIYDLNVEKKKRYDNYNLYKKKK